MTSPIPVKFEAEDKEWLDYLVAESGLNNRSEVMRRAVRALAIAVKRAPDWNWVKDTRNPICLNSETPEERLGMLAQAMDEAAAKVERTRAVRYNREHPRKRSA